MSPERPADPALRTSRAGRDADALHGDEVHPADLQLARDLLRRDSRALQHFVARMQCVPRFLAMRNARMGAPLRREEIEDVTQEVLSTVWRKLPEYRGDARLETWAYRICEFELCNAVRRTVRRRTASLSDVGEVPAAPLLDRAEDLEAVHAALDALPDDERTAVRRKHFEDETFEQAGTRLGLSPNTVKTRYYRGLDAIRRMLRRREAEL